MNKLKEFFKYFFVSMVLLSAVAAPLVLAISKHEAAWLWLEIPVISALIAVSVSEEDE